MSDPYRSHRPVSTELKADHYPNTAERIIRTVRDVCAIVALVLVSLLMFGLFNALSELGNAVERVAPEPTVSECVGELEC
jgi:hypothetical protein